jgi:hypothetical protein
MGRCYLLALVDESGTCAQARFARADSVEENLQVLLQYVTQWGRPMTIVTNRKTLFRGNPLSSSARSLGRGDSRIQGVLRELSIEWIGDDRPMAGALKSFFRKAKAMEVESLRMRIHTMEAANRYLQKAFLPRAVGEATGPVAGDMHRPLAADPFSLFSKITIRSVHPNGMLHYRGKCYRLQSDRGVMPGESIRIEERLDGTLRVTAGENSVRLVSTHVPVTKPTPPSTPKMQDRRRNGRPKNREWMANFLNGPHRPLWMVLKPRPALE